MMKAEAKMAFAVYVVLTSTHNLLSSVSRRILHHDFDVSSVVLLGEILKLGVSLALVLFVDKLDAQQFTENVVYKSLPMLVPALLYFAQNCLYYFELQLVSPAVFITLGQLRLLITAVFATLFLSQRFALDQWRALGILSIGAVLVQSHGGSAEFSTMSLLGPVLIIIHCCSSALAGVYFEKVLKERLRISVWQRNVQLSCITIVFALLSKFFVGSSTVESFFRGFNPLVWLLVCFQGLNGLVIAFLIKSADNIIKNFGSTFAIVLTCLVDYLLLGTPLGLNFLLGVLLILISVFMYRDAAPKVPEPPVKNSERIPLTTATELIEFDSDV